jgi:hypothetical protein
MRPDATRHESVPALEKFDDRNVAEQVRKQAVHPHPMRAVASAIARAIGRTSFSALLITKWRAAEADV